MNRSFTVSVALLVCFAASATFAGGPCAASRGGGPRVTGAHHAGYATPSSQVYYYPNAMVSPVRQAPLKQSPDNQLQANQAQPRQRPASALPVRQVSPPQPPVVNSSSAPIANTATDALPSEKEEVEGVVQNLNQAMEAFRVGNNHQAMVLADRLIAAMPKHSDLLQFRSLIHLRSSDWTKAAADMYDSLQHGAIWSQEQVDRVYGDADRYQRELRMLRLLVDSQPDNLATQFLSAYHHLVAKEIDSARKTLQYILTIKPNEPVAVALLRQMETQPSQTGAQPSQNEVTHTGT